MNYIILLLMIVLMNCVQVPQYTSGEDTTVQYNSGHVLQTSTTASRYVDCPVSFSFTFTYSPQIMFAISYLDMDGTVNGYSAVAQSISTTGFVIRYKAYTTSLIYSIRSFWYALLDDMVTVQTAIVPQASFSNYVITFATLQTSAPVAVIFMNGLQFSVKTSFVYTLGTPTATQVTLTITVSNGSAISQALFNIIYAQSTYLSGGIRSMTTLTSVTLLTIDAYTKFQGQGLSGYYTNDSVTRIKGASTISGSSYSVQYSSWAGSTMISYQISYFAYKPCAKYCVSCLTTGPTYCTACIASTQRNTNPLCTTCNYGYYMPTNEQGCITCSIYCDGCVSPSGNCVICLASTLRINTPLCTDCPISYYAQSGNIVCQQCSSNCYQCVNQANQCTACYQFSYREVDSNFRCSCIVRYYEYNNQCQQCDSSCLTCSGQYYVDCLSCDPQDNRIYNNQTGECICQQYFALDENQNCRPICGDLIIIAPFEQCDDGNVNNYDGCNNNCRYQCQSQCKYCVIGYCNLCMIGWEAYQGICRPKWNDGVVQIGYEECDDGNRILFDGCNDGRYQCDQLCLTCAKGNCTNCQYNSVLQTSQQCDCPYNYSLLPSINYCVQCDPSCQKCYGQSKYQCTLCDQGLMRYLTNSQCLCQVHYFDNNNICTKCHPQCYSCYGSSINQCITCYSEQNRFLDSFTNYCKCYNGYEESVNYVCIPSCGDIITIVPYEQCDDGNNNDFDGCNNQCRFQCQQECKTCVQGYCNNCIIGWIVISGLCYPKYNDGVIQSGYEECDDGNIVLYDGCNDGAYQCDQMCNTCTKGNCTICQSNSVLQPKLNCDCPYNYSLLPSINYCVQCDPSCQKCYGQSKYQCTLCDQGLMRYLTNSQCLCQVHYFDNNNICTKCHPQCYSCYGSSINQCITCYSEQNRFLDSSTNYCECYNGYEESVNYVCIPSCGDIITIVPYEQCDDGNNNDFDGCNNQCRFQCQQECKTCVQGYCNNCIIGWIVISGLCYPKYNDGVIQSGYEECDDGNIVLYDGCNDGAYQCDQMCNTCTKGNCTICQFNSVLQPKLNCDCPYNYSLLPSINYCVQCDPSCQKCYGQSKYQCTLCDQGLMRYLTNSQCLCQVHYFDNNNICTKCHPQCYSCYGSSINQCITCYSEQNRFLDSFTNYCKCYNGYEESVNYVCIPSCGDIITIVPYEQCDDGNNNDFDGCNNQCRFQCQQECKTCVQGYCNNCIIGWIVISGLCYPKYNDGVIQSGYEECDDGNIVLYDGCNDGAYQCDQMCNTCVNGLCHSCSSNSLLTSQLNCQCPDNYSVVGDLQFCIKCDQTCQKCFGQSYDQCLQCDALYLRYLHNEKCLCQPHYYDSNGLCLPCHSQCFSCIGPANNQCIDCYATQNRILNRNSSKCECQLEYMSLDQDYCNPICGDQRVIYPIEQCDDGNKNNYDGCNNNCLYQCQNECITCIMGECWSCIKDWSIIGSECVYSPPCHQTCRTCSGPQYNQCLSCYENQNRMLLESQCACLSYFGIIDDSLICSPTCGDSVAIIPYEQCDDGNLIPFDGCNSCFFQCQEQCRQCITGNCYMCISGWQLSQNKCIPQCGDMIVQYQYEECDDNGPVTLTGCTNCHFQCNQYCTACNSGLCQSCYPGTSLISHNSCGQVCGDQLVFGTEQCDDGNSTPFDGCYNCMFQCELECDSCFNGQCLVCKNLYQLINGRCIEACQAIQSIMPHQNSHIDCGLGCLYCCQGICLKCDVEWNLNNNQCQPICGDGHVVGSEQCDSADIYCKQCQIVCPPLCSYCTTTVCQQCITGYRILPSNECQTDCGDAYLTQYEQCDDGNNYNFDGCSSKCTLEPQWQCTDQLYELSYCYFWQAPQMMLFLVNHTNLTQFVSINFTQQIKIQSYSHQIPLFDIFIENIEESDYLINMTHPYVEDFENLQTLNFICSVKFFTPIQLPVLAVKTKQLIINSENIPLVNNQSFLQLSNYYIFNSSEQKSFDLFIVINKVIIILLFLISLVSLFYRDMQQFYNYIDFLQRLSYIRYINVIFPYHLELYLGVFDSLTLDSFFLNFKLYQDTFSSYFQLTKDKFHYYGDNAVFILNIQSRIILIFICILLYSIITALLKQYLLKHYSISQFLRHEYLCKYIYSLTYKIYRFLDNCIKELERGRSSFFEQFLYNFTISALLQISCGYMWDPFSIINYAISIIAILLLFSGFIARLQRVSNYQLHHSQEDIRIKNVKGASQQHNTQQQFNASTIVVFRKIYFCITLVLFQASPVIQIFSMILLQLSALVQLIFHSQIDSRPEQTKLIIEESLLTIVYFSFIFLSDNIFITSRQIETGVIGWINIGLLTSILIIRLQIDIYQVIIIRVRNYIRRKDHVDISQDPLDHLEHKVRQTMWKIR